MVNPLPPCQRAGCPNRVKEARRAFCSSACGRIGEGASPTQRFDVKGNTAELSMPTTERVRSLEDLVRVCKIDTKTWDVERFTCQTQEMAAMPRATGSKQDGWKRDSTTPIVQQLFHVKAWLTRRVLILGVEQELKALLADAQGRIRRLKDAKPLRRKSSGDHMLEIGIYDAHFGKLAWDMETGHGNYDLKIAERDFADALETILARTRSFGFDQIVFVLGNDLMNSDSRANQTTAGTPQDTDGRYHKAFGIVRQAATRAIDRLRAIAPVRVPMVPGNHDTMGVWHLGDSLQCYYHGQTDVVIDNDPKQRKYHQYGANMLMWTHGDKGKRANYPQVMASEQPSMWGATKYREIHLGHRHLTEVASFPGVQVRTLRALTATDAWHAEQGYVGNLRGAEAFVWHRTEGLVSQTLYTVPETKQRKGA